jgi:hypothetical protein
MKTAFLLQSSVSASAERSNSRKRSRLGEHLLMAGCAAAAFVFVTLFVFGVL